MMKKYLFVDILISLLTIVAAFSQSNASTYDLKRISPNWIAVLGGNVLCEPVRTSYGFAVVGEGKMVSAFTPSGTVLWQRSFTKSIKPYLTVGLSDMLYVVSGTSMLTMLNPSGAVIWSADTGFPIQNEPLAGRDGRVFVNGKNTIACYGTNAVCRWSIETEAQDKDAPPAELNDGSLLVFLSKTENGRSVASRVSPFGVVMENIIFTGKVKQAVSCKEGTLLTFTDGSAGFCSVKDGTLDSRWVIASSDGVLSSHTAACSADLFLEKKVVLCSGNPARLYIVSTVDGSISNTINTNTIDTADISCLTFSPDGIIAADNNSALCTSADGSFVWEATFNPLKKWNYLFPTDSGYIAFCGTNWVIEAYRMKQTLGVDGNNPLYIKRASAYKSFYAKTQDASSALTGSAIPLTVCNEMEAGYANGNFGEKDSLWLPLLDNDLASFTMQWGTSTRGHLSEKSYFETNIAYDDKLLSLAGASGTVLFQGYIASLLGKVNDPSLLQSLVFAAGSLAFDPNEQMLYALQEVLHKSSPKDQALLLIFCDSVYNICKYMGRPAFFEYGEKMIASLLYPQYPGKVREYARTTLDRISKLKL